jgi:hypothetical protein
MARLTRLESFAHAECVSGIVSYASFLAEKLEASAREPSASGRRRGDARAVERAMLVALTASVASEEADALETFLGPSSSWGDDVLKPAAAAARRRRRRRGDAAGDAASRSLEALRGVSKRGFAFWAESFAAGLGDALSDALERDESSRSEETREDWEEDPTASRAGVTVCLPASASPHAFEALHAACVEAVRRGGDALPAAATRALATASARACLAAFQKRFSAVSSGERAVSEKGAIQALFDVWFVTDVLVDGRWDGAEKETSRALCKTLSDVLDPIDWATCEAPLRRNVGTAKKRSGVVFGVLGSRVGSEGGGHHATILPASAATAIAPSIAEAPIASRFAYLPVGAPPARRFAADGASRRSRGALGEDWDSPNGVLLDWSAAGFDRFVELETRETRAENSGNFFGKLAGQGLGLGKAAAGAMAWAL